MNSIFFPRFVVNAILARLHVFERCAALVDGLVRAFAMASSVSHTQRGRAMGRGATGRLGGTGAGRTIGRVQQFGFGWDVDGWGLRIHELYNAFSESAKKRFRECPRTT